MNGDATPPHRPVADIAFREATEADAQALASLRVDAMRESLERIGRFDPTRARDSPRHQGLGIGAAVLAQAFAEADAAGQPLRVGALRESASNRFCQRHGFVLVEQGEFDNHYVRHANAAG